MELWQAIKITWTNEVSTKVIELITSVFVSFDIGMEEYCRLYYIYALKNIKMFPDIFVWNKKQDIFLHV